MLPVLCATLAAEDFVEVRRWGEEKLGFLRTTLPFAHGIPPHDTLNAVPDALDPGLFSERFVAWVEALRESEPDIVAVDGRSSRRARAKGGHPLHVVSAWATRQRLVLGQEAVGRISQRDRRDPAAPEAAPPHRSPGDHRRHGHPDRHRQDHPRQGRRRSPGPQEPAPAQAGDTWPVLADDVRLFFADPGAARLATHETTDLDHGRSETRRHVVCHDIDGLTGERRYPGQPCFPGLKAVARVEATVGRGDKTSAERRSFLSSLPRDAKLFARAVRAHWGIENRLHRVLDVVFHDDLMRLRAANGPQSEHGHHQAHGHEPHPQRLRQGQPQDTP